MDRTEKEGEEAGAGKEEVGRETTHGQLTAAAERLSCTEASCGTI